MKLNTFNIKIRKKIIRPGRVIGSGKGKTSGRGHKGQKSRSGVAIKSFEGGQMPLYRRLPKRGFNSFKNKKNIALINLSRIQDILQKKTISTSDTVSLNMLQKNNILSKKYKKLKLLGSGDIKDKLTFEVNFVSNSAKEKIEKLGGKINLIK